MLTTKSFQKKLLEKYYNRNNNHWRLRIELARRLVEFYALPRLKLIKHINEIVVVDLGCSIGTFALEFAREGYRAYGLDTDAEAINIAHQLAYEEKSDACFIQANITRLNSINIPPIDIAICFDIFEHLHDDELGVLLQSIRRKFSNHGTLIFHTFPTQHDYLFYQERLITKFLSLFIHLNPLWFERLTNICANIYDVYTLLTIGKTYQETIKYSNHCNPTTIKRLKDILIRAGYKILVLESTQLYSFQIDIQKQFFNHPLSHRNIYGVAVSK